MERESALAGLHTLVLLNSALTSKSLPLPASPPHAPLVPTGCVLHPRVLHELRGGRQLSRRKLTTAQPSEASWLMRLPKMDVCLAASLLACGPRDAGGSLGLPP